VVVIDPGHGGINAGARNVASGGWEKEYTLDWARRLAPLLEERGWKAFLTRTNDTDLSLGDRVAVAEAHHADLFISLHFNSSAESGHEQPGLETLCLTPTGMPSDITRDFPDNPREVFPNNAFDADNVRWAMRVQAALLKADGLADRGVRRARFPGVLRTQKRAAVLIEGGFLSNPTEARRIASAEHRQQLAEALARAFGETDVRGQKPEIRGQQTDAPVTNSTSTGTELRTMPTP
jgi:N-acetylmuramoyl-L-alanine amidase